MLRTTKYILCLTFMLLLVAGCSDDLYLDKTEANGSAELPIDFEFTLPDASATRSFSDGEIVKTAFTNGDMIHILGTFSTEELQEDGTYKPGKLSRYGALRYDGKNWVEAAGNNLKWPTVATDGRFKAYYISGSNGMLTDTIPSAQFLLSEITPASDPLEAATPENSPVIYGHGVKLDFNHLCAHLMLKDLEPQVATSYWFKRDGVANFNNAFRIVLGKDGLGPTLNFEFCQIPDAAFKNLVYIPAKTISTIEENDRVITSAGYFLEPGNYDTFSVCYQASDTTIYDYLKYDFNAIPDKVGGVDKENTRPDLKAGTTYTLTITRSPGVTITSPSSAEGWDDNGEYFEVDVEAFLKAVYDKKDYTEKGTKILEATATGTKLLHNVDFKYFKYEKFEDTTFDPNIMEGVVFDGDYHYIKNLGSPLFRYNYGIIKNVGIDSIKIEEAMSYEDTQKDMSRHGALCMWNRANATINNVRVSSVNMMVFVRSEIQTGTDGSEVHNIGCVVGSNTGKVSEVALAGTFVLDVKGVENKPVNASVLIGGIVGQNAAEGEIYDVFPLENNLSIKITNQCVGETGSYSVGGVVGESTGKISGVILSDVTIDGEKSRGAISYIGGIAGQLSLSESTGATVSLESCIVSGSVTAGVTSPYGAITSGSYIGGIVGADLGVPVLDCRTAVSVHGSGAANDNVIYATGGAFGRIREASTYNFGNLITYGSALDGPNNAEKTQYIGNFAGIVPNGQTWDEDYSKKNILVRTFDGIKHIGIAQ